MHLIRPYAAACVSGRSICLALLGKRLYGV